MPLVKLTKFVVLSFTFSCLASGTTDIKIDLSGQGAAFSEEVDQAAIRRLVTDKKHDVQSCYNDTCR